MYRSLFNRRRGPEARRRRWPRSRAGGCLLWIVLIVVLLIVLSVLFGGFQKGTKETGLAPAAATSMIVNSLGQIVTKTVHDHEGLG